MAYKIVIALRGNRDFIVAEIGGYDNREDAELELEFNLELVSESEIAWIEDDS